jgi:hypothetical protein
MIALGSYPDESPRSVTGQDLHSPGAESAILAAKLCTTRMWERVDGGYRVLDWPAVQVWVDHVHELRDKDNRSPAREMEFVESAKR